MDVEIDVGRLQADMGEALRQALENPTVLEAVHEAMGSAFHTIVLQNFGDSGVDRPTAWPALSPRYAKRVKRSHATLVLSGELMRSVKSEATSDHAHIWSDTEYSAAHQFGEGRMPERPFFPIQGDSLTDYAEQQIVEAVQRTLADTFSSPYNED